MRNKKISVIFLKDWLVVSYIFYPFLKNLKNLTCRFTDIIDRSKPNQNSNQPTSTTLETRTVPKSVIFAAIKSAAPAINFLFGFFIIP